MPYLCPVDGCGHEAKSFHGLCSHFNRTHLRDGICPFCSKHFQYVNRHIANLNTRGSGPLYMIAHGLTGRKGKKSTALNIWREARTFAREATWVPPKETITTSPEVLA